MVTGEGDRPATADVPWQADFDAFVREHWTELHATVSRAARRYRQEPDDALQEALLRAYASRHTFTSERHAVNWICRVARDLLCDQRRSWYGRRVTTSDDMPETSFAPDPAEVVAGRETDGYVLRAVAALPADHRLVLWQHAVEGRSYADIARESARPLATIRSVALRARERARRHLATSHGPFGIGALHIRLVTWRARVLPVPAEPIAALLVLAVPLAFGAGAGGGGVRVTTATPPPPVTGVAPQAGGMPRHRPGSSLPGRAEPIHPTATSTMRHAAPEATPRGPGVIDTRLGSEGLTSGERWGTCEFGGAPPRPRTKPVYALADAGWYDCHVEAKSTTCVMSATESLSTPCSWTLRGDVASIAKGVGAGRLCNARAGEGTFALTIAGVSYDIPVEPFLSDDGVLVNAGVDLPGRHVSVSLQIVYTCTEVNARAPLVTGRVMVTGR